MARIKWAATGGALAGSLNDSATTFTAPELAGFPAVTGGDIAALVLDPKGENGTPEVVWVTAHTAGATTATVLRGQEQGNGVGPARSHAAGTRWSHGPTIEDYTGPFEAIDAETTARTAAITALQTDIDSKETPAGAQEKVDLLGQSITDGVGNHLAQIEESVADETAARIAADEALQADIDSKETPSGAQEKVDLLATSIEESFGPVIAGLTADINSKETPAGAQEKVDAAVDALDARLPRVGFLSERPPAADVPGMEFFAVDDLGGRSSFSDGVTWIPMSMSAAATSFDPVGELTAVDVQAALTTLDARTGTLAPLDRWGAIQSYMEDFQQAFTVAAASTKTERLINGETTGTATVTAPALPLINGATLLNVSASTDVAKLQWLAAAPGGARVAYEARTTMTATADANAVRMTAGWQVFGSEDGAYFRIYRGATPTIHAVCRNGGAETEVNTGIAVTALANVRFRVVPDGSGIVRFYVDGQLAATISTNVPTGGTFWLPTFRLAKVSGSDARTTSLDYVAWAGIR